MYIKNKHTIQENIPAGASGISGVPRRGGIGLGGGPLGGMFKGLW